MILKSYKAGMVVHLLTPEDKLNALLTPIASKLDGLSGVKEVCSLFWSTTWGEGGSKLSGRHRGYTGAPSEIRVPSHGSILL